jgi:hypothetical protein
VHFQRIPITSSGKSSFPFGQRRRTGQSTRLQRYKYVIFSSNAKTDSCRKRPRCFTSIHFVARNKRWNYRDRLGRVFHDQRSHRVAEIVEELQKLSEAGFLWSKLPIQSKIDELTIDLFSALQRKHCRKSMWLKYNESGTRSIKLTVCPRS